jgi:AmmeMemoRadiSam system protein A
MAACLYYILISIIACCKNNASEFQKMDEDSYPEQNIDCLTDEEQKILLQLAREALIDGVHGKILIPLDLDSLPPKLTQFGATFVTLTKSKELRGCIGSLEATRPLAEDVRLHSVAAALEDYRFPPVQVNEIDQISIEISRLTPPQLLEADNPEAILSKIHPGLDGVIIKKGFRRATFLPQVWEKVPEVEIFLAMLCRKMGTPTDFWRQKDVQILTYRVEKFQE